MGQAAAHGMIEPTLQACVVCSDMPDELTRRLLLERAPDLQTAVDTALAELAAGDRVAVLPHAALTIPTIRAPAEMI